METITNALNKVVEWQMAYCMPWAPISLAGVLLYMGTIAYLDRRTK